MIESTQHPFISVAALQNCTKRFAVRVVLIDSAHSVLLLSTHDVRDVLGAAGWWLRRRRGRRSGSRA